MAASIVSEIQRIVKSCIESLKVCNIAYGTVQNTDPLEVELEQTMLDLPEDCLVLTDTVKGDNALKKGDKVIMIRATGGQQYVILSKTT